MKGEEKNEKNGKDKREGKKKPVSLRKGIQNLPKMKKEKNFDGIATEEGILRLSFAVLLVGDLFFINAAKQDLDRQVERMFIIATTRKDLR